MAKIIETYKKIEDKFIGIFLAKNGESSDSAKDRIIAEMAAYLQRP